MISNLRRNYDDHSKVCLQERIPSRHITLNDTLNKSPLNIIKPELFSTLKQIRQNPQQQHRDNNDKYFFSSLGGSQEKNKTQEKLLFNRYLKEYQYLSYGPQQIQGNDRPPLESINLDRNKQNLQSIQKQKINQKCNPPKTQYSINFSQEDKSFNSFKSVQQTCNLKSKSKDNSLSKAFQTRSIQKYNNFQQKNIINKEIQPQILISKQQIVLLKYLRQQNHQLKTQLSQKNSYILQLETKLQNYLKQKIQIQKKEGNMLQILELKLQNFKKQMISYQKEILKHKQQLISYQNLFAKLMTHFKVQHSQKTNQFQDNNIQKIIEIIQSEKNTFKTFIQKIEEMKQKIQFKTHSKNAKLFNHHPSKDHFLDQKSLNLKQLWKWLKKVGKQYEIMKQKVSQINFSFDKKV